MQFQINTAGEIPDVGAIEDAIRTVDPSALVDLDAAGRIRIAATIDVPQLSALINLAGYPISPQQVQLLPSECCGGCGG